MEEFSPIESRILNRYFTNADLPVFGIINLPEVVKGALYARYSRSPKSLRRLFLDEFYNDSSKGVDQLAQTLDSDGRTFGLDRAEKLYARVFTDFGDDSVAQLGGAHIACENISNVLTKVIEKPRLGSYLEQSTRYIVYDQRKNDRWKFSPPPELKNTEMGAEFESVMNQLFETYTWLVKELQPKFEAKFPKQPADPESAWKATIRAKCCDVARGLLPASVLSNVGIYATGQTYELLLMRMFAHPLAEARECAALMLTELRKIIPDFLRRVDMPERGKVWTEYFAQNQIAMAKLAAECEAPVIEVPAIDLVDWDCKGEDKVIAAALFEYTDASSAALENLVSQYSPERKAEILATYVGNRTNRRHRPGRAFERTEYKFDCVADYGCFRDLQRHRMLSMEWQHLGSKLGFITPPELDLVPQAQERWTAVMERAGQFAEKVKQQYGSAVAQYAVPFAYRIRFTMQMNAREAMHMIELRTQPQGHINYRRICGVMHELIRERAGHRLLADAMKFVDTQHYELNRLDAERKKHAREQSAGTPG